MGKKITITEDVRMPSYGPPRFLTWAVAIAAAPFTAGASLVGGVIFELGAKADRRRAADAIDESGSIVDAADAINETIESGSERTTVSSYHDLGYMGMGTVERKLRFRQDED